jgi:CubicO group peptidase (beta-lactamase class C family)
MGLLSSVSGCGGGLVGAGLTVAGLEHRRLLPELAERRVLRRMDGPLDDTLPANRPVTTRDLLTFTFGFGMATEMFTSPAPWPVVEAANALDLATIGPPNPDVQPDPDTWIANLGSLPLLAQPGERWLYNTGSQVLGVLLARAAGEPFAEVLRTRVFDPLGMRDTGFWTPQAHRLATAYQRPSPTAWSSGIRQTASGVTPRRSVTVRQDLSRQPTTFFRSLVCCCVAVARCCRPARCMP